MPTTPLLLLLLAVATYAQPQQPLQDQRDGKTYKTVKIGEQIWMAENLNYNAEGSKCYNNKLENCEKYGRLYNWETAMKSCLSGWHLPSNKEWQTLVDFVGGKDIAGKKLKAKSGWRRDYEGKSGNGTDEYEFSALPGAFGFTEGHFLYVDEYGKWWSSNLYSIDIAYGWSMYYSIESASLCFNDLRGLFSVRCVKD